MFRLVVLPCFDLCTIVCLHVKLVLIFLLIMKIIIIVQIPPITLFNDTSWGLPYTLNSNATRYFRI